MDTAFAQGGDIAIHATGSSLLNIKGQIISLLKKGINVVSTCEELSYPWDKEPEISAELDAIAKENNVTVLATGQSLARQPGPGDRPRQTQKGYSTVSFEVTLREAELLVFAQTVKGQLYLALRNPSDMSFVTDLPQINFEHLHKKLPELNLIRQRDIRHKKDI